jgi:hypothetical protein
MHAVICIGPHNQLLDNALYSTHKLEASNPLHAALRADPLPVLLILAISLQVCVASGKAVRDAPWQRCKTCKRAMITAELAGRRSCPLCHSQLPQEAGKGRGPKQARIIEGAAA